MVFSSKNIVGMVLAQAVCVGALKVKPGSPTRTHRMSMFIDAATTSLHDFVSGPKVFFLFTYKDIFDQSSHSTTHHNFQKSRLYSHID